MPAARTYRETEVSTPFAQRQAPPFTSLSSALDATSAEPSGTGERPLSSAYTSTKVGSITISDLMLLAM